MCIEYKLILLSLFELLFISVALGGVDGMGISKNRNNLTILMLEGINCELRLIHDQTY